MKTNHYLKKAVALQYSQSQEAPVVKGKGLGIVAEEIISRAKEHHIHIHEDKALIELLMQLEIEQEIPTELYQVIAEIFAMLYRLEKKQEQQASAEL